MRSLCPSVFSVFKLLKWFLLHRIFGNETTSV